MPFTLHALIITMHNFMKSNWCIQGFPFGLSATIENIVIGIVVNPLQASIIITHLCLFCQMGNPLGRKRFCFTIPIVF